MRTELLGIPLAVAGLAGSVVAIAGRAADPLFEVRQRHPRPLTAEAVERAVGEAPEPVPGPRTRSAEAHCSSRVTGDLRNPWTCTVRYRSGESFRYRVEVEADGSYRGQDRTGQHLIYGCCAKPPE